MLNPLNVMVQVMSHCKAHAGNAAGFTAGNDLGDFLKTPPKGSDSPVLSFLRAIAAFPKPLVAAVNGFVIGVGTTMLLHCDLVYASDDAKFSMPFTSLGLCPEAVGRPGGWGVVVGDGKVERQLTATRSGEVRVFKRLETLVGYLQGVGIQRFEVDTTNFDPTSVSTYQRPDASQALKRAHAAALHDQWFREQVKQSLTEADDAKTKWVTNDQTKVRAARRRAAWRKSDA